MSGNGFGSKNMEEKIGIVPTTTGQGLPYRLQFVFLQTFSTSVLAGVAQWIEHRLAKLRVAGLISSQGTCLGCGPGP